MTSSMTHVSVPGRHGELQVTVGDVRLAVVEAAPAQELLADGGEGSVTAHYQVRLDLLFGSFRPAQHQQPNKHQQRIHLCCVTIFLMLL